MAATRTISDSLSEITRFVELLDAKVAYHRMLDFEQSGREAPLSYAERAEPYSASGPREVQQLAERLAIDAELYGVSAEALIVVGADPSDATPSITQELKREAMALRVRLQAAEEGRDPKPRGNRPHGGQPGQQSAYWPEDEAEEFGDGGPQPETETEVAVAANYDNEERDRWLWERQSAGDTRRLIRSKLKADHPKWEQLETDQAVSNAVKRYCERTRKPRPGKR